jgi:uncharacterized membrane protein (UPF0127 family)
MWRIVILVLGICFSIIILLWAALYIQDQQAATSCPFRVSPRQTDGSSSVKNPLAKPPCIRLTRITTPDAQRQGLSDRENMDDTEGLLFDFGVPGQRCMWMKDMLFNLDMVWLDQNARITAISQNIKPETFPKTFCGSGHDTYVIEVNAGVAKAAHLYIGQQLKL